MKKRFKSWPSLGTVHCIQPWYEGRDYKIISLSNMIERPIRKGQVSNEAKEDLLELLIGI